MSYVVRYSPSARKDIDKVWDDVFSASASLEVTERYITDFLDVIAQKKEFPESGIPLYYRGLFTGFYSVNFKAYKAFYRVRGNYVEVVRVLLQKQEYMTVLKTSTASLDKKSRCISDMMSRIQ